MNTATLTKLMLSGVAAGIALSCAVVLATSVSTLPTTTVTTAKNDALETISTKGDRVHSDETADQVVRSGKSDALEITIAILKGDDVLPGDRQPILGEIETAAVEPAEEAAPETETEDVLRGPVSDALPEPAAEETVAAPPPAAPTPRAVRVTRTLGDPLNIVPVPEPVENRPAASPATNTNFTVEPIETTESLRDRSDLVR